MSPVGIVSVAAIADEVESLKSQGLVPVVNIRHRIQQCDQEALDELRASEASTCKFSAYSALFHAQMLPYAELIVHQQERRQEFALRDLSFEESDCGRMSYNIKEVRIVLERALDVLCTVAMNGLSDSMSQNIARAAHSGTMLSTSIQRAETDVIQSRIGMRSAMAPVQFQRIVEKLEDTAQRIHASIQDLYERTH